MTRRAPSDLELVAALSSRLPSHAPAGLRDEIVEMAAATRQQSAVPAFLGRLFDADPAARRRAVLLLAAAALALALAGAVAMGALVDQQRRRQSFDPPRDLSGYIDAAYRGLAELPAFEMTALEQGDRHRILSDGRGTIRDERASTGVTRIVSRDRVVQLGTDPSGTPTFVESGASDVIPGLELGRYMSFFQQCETAPVYRGFELLLGRPTHRIECGPREYSLDIETMLVLRSRTASVPLGGPSDQNGGPSPASLADWEVIELRLGEPPEDLFSFVAPSGYVTIRFDAATCPDTGFATCTEPVASGASEAPFVTPPPAPGAAAPPNDLAAFIGAVEARYAHPPALEMVIRDSAHRTGDPTVLGQPSDHHHWSDGNGRFRTQLNDDEKTIYITTGGHIWISGSRDGSAVWLDDFGPYADHGGVGDMELGFDPRCPDGWRSHGVELVLDRPAVHVSCGTVDDWIDLEWLLVMRQDVRPTDPLELVSSTSEVVEIHLGPQPEDLFQLPHGAVTVPKPSAPSEPLEPSPAATPG